MDMQGLLAQLAGPDQGMTDSQMQFAAAQGGPLSGLRAAQMKLNQNIEQTGTRGLTSLLGGDPRTKAEMVQDILSRHDNSSEDGQSATLQALRKAGFGDVAEQMRDYFVQQEQQKIELGQKGRELDILQQNADSTARNAAVNERNSRINMLNAARAATQERIENANAGQLDMEGLKEETRGDFKATDYTRESYGRYRQALAKANNRFQVADAVALLVPQLEDGYEIRQMPNASGEMVEVQYPATGKAMKEWAAEAEQLNTENYNVRAASGDIIDNIDRAFEIRDGSGSKLQDGIFGALLSFKPGTAESELRILRENLANQVGFTQLLDAKRSSPSGASGFGALSAPELDLLKTQWGNVTSIHTSLETKFENMRLIRDKLVEVRKRANVKWDRDSLFMKRQFDQENSKQLVEGEIDTPTDVLLRDYKAALQAQQGGAQ